MMLNLTHHADVRIQQRGIPPLIIDLLMNYGRLTRHKGADVYFLDSESRKSLKRDIGSLVYKRLQDLLDAYVVVADDGLVITAAKRYRRLKT